MLRCEIKIVTTLFILTGGFCVDAAGNVTEAGCWAAIDTAEVAAAVGPEAGGGCWACDCGMADTCEAL